VFGIIDTGETVRGQSYFTNDLELDVLDIKLAGFKHVLSCHLFDLGFS